MAHRLQITLTLAFAAGLLACSSGDKPAADAATRSDSSSGEVAQYALMKNRIGWLTDSNIVALAAQVNDDAQEIVRLEAQVWSRESMRQLATEILRDHARMRVAIDSLASLKRIPSQMPAVAPEVKAPYDSLLATQTGLPMTDREAQLIDMILKVHGRSALDFGALGVNATDPDLRALLSNRAVLMEQAHVARTQLLEAAIAAADSARKDSVKATGRGGRR